MLGKISVFKICSSGIWGWRFSWHFLKVFRVFEAHFLITICHMKKPCIALGVGHKIVHISTPFPYFSYFQLSIYRTLYSFFIQGPRKRGMEKGMVGFAILLLFTRVCSTGHFYMFIRLWDFWWWSKFYVHHK